MQRSSSSFRRSGGRSTNHQRVSRNERAARVKAPSLFPHSAANLRKQHAGKKDDDHSDPLEQQNDSSRTILAVSSKPYCDKLQFIFWRGRASLGLRRGPKTFQRLPNDS